MNREVMRRFQKVVFFFLVLSAIPARADKPEHRKIAEYYAPVIYQETKSAVLDFVTRFDFDGDWNGANNWKHAYLYELPANVYQMERMWLRFVLKVRRART